MKHNSAIKVLMTHLGKLNEALKQANEILEGDFEMVGEYEFALNDAANIESEIIAINDAVETLRKAPFERVKILEGFLEEAVAGLEWRKDEPPAPFDKSDEERVYEWKKALKK